MDLLSLIVLRFKITCKEESHEKVFRSSCSNRQLRSPRFRGGDLCGFRSRESQMHDDAQPANRSDEEHGQL
jgi:hypothetical protein